MATNKVSLGIIGGHKIYADAGNNEMRLLENQVRKEVGKIKLQDGKKYMMLMEGEQGEFLITVSIERSTRHDTKAV